MSASPHEPLIDPFYVAGWLGNVLRLGPGSSVNGLSSPCWNGPKSWFLSGRPAGWCEMGRALDGVRRLFLASKILKPVAMRKGCCRNSEDNIRPPPPEELTSSKTMILPDQVAPFGIQMSSPARKSKLAVRRIVAPEPITDSECNAVERTLARFVALAYVGDHPDSFTAVIERQSDEPLLNSSAVPLEPPRCRRTQ